MRDRVWVMKGMLSDDGAIFVSIDKNERTILDHVLSDVFGAENKVEELIGSESILLLLSSPEAMDYYPRIGFEKVENGWIIKRKR